MDDEQFQNFLNSLSGLGTTAKNKDTSNIERGAFGLPLDSQPKQSQPTKSLTDSGVGSIPVLKQLTQFGVGVGTNVGKGIIGAGQTILKGANAIGNKLGTGTDQYNPIIQTLESIKTGIFEDPYKKENSSFLGKAGGLTGEVAQFALGNAPISKGQQFLTGATEGLNVGNKVLNYGLRKTAQIIPEAIGMGGIQYATSGGDSKSAKEVGIASAVISGLTHVGADAFRQVIPQTVKDAVSKVFIPRGKIKLGGTENIADDAVGALTTIKNLAPDIKVIDADGIEKAFIPEKATLLEMPQVLLQAKNKIYNAYTELATKAGEAGANFGQADFNSVISDLSKYEGKGYTASFSNKAKQIQEALNRYGTQNSKDGFFYFKDTSPAEIQTLIEALNRDVNPLSDKAGAEVALDVSRKLREILDSKIANATGEGYQQLRNAYSQLKSIEPTVINEFKKALRGQGIQGDIIDKIATVDTITGLLSGNPVAVARGLTWESVKIAWAKALGKESNLQRAFKLMSKSEKEASNLAQRTIANPAETGAFKAGEKLVNDIKTTPNKTGGFVRFGGKEFPSLKEVKVPNAPEGISINVGLKTNTGGEITDQEVKDILKKEFNVDVVEGAVQQSGTEPTLVAKLSRELTDDELYKLTETLKKDAIPQLSNGVGKMTNIGKDSWGDFNPQYFMDNTGKTIASEVKATPAINPDLPTLKTLTKLEGRDSVSKQFISDLTNSGDLKQQERDVLRQVLSTMPEGKVNVAEFNQKVQTELLPLKVLSSAKNDIKPRYENTTLPTELRGDVKNYSENIYESPIKTSAGDTHFPRTAFDGTRSTDAPNYFGHTRIEDMEGNKVRRVIEVQSDLYQKGNLETSVKQLQPDGKVNKNYVSDVNKLQQYNDPTAHFRMIREEIKKASQDGKTKLQFPTGETAMKIEGLGDETVWSLNNSTSASPKELKVGKEIYRGNQTIGTDENDAWIITDVLGDGKFKAVPKGYFEDRLNAHFLNEGLAKKGIMGEAEQKSREKMLSQINTDSSITETFDISGKVDTNNPIYKFYQKDVANYLKRFNGKLVKDKQGVEWIEIPIDKKMAKLPVEAFGIVAGVGIGASANKKNGK